MPEIHGNEWRYVKECLDTNWVSSVGSYVDRFEKMIAEQAGAKYAVATVTGTAALHVALLLAGVERDDEVLVSTLTFIAPVNAIRYVNAWPVFIDAEPIYWQMDPARVSQFLEHECRREGDELRNRKTGRRIKAILPVHILGHPVDLDPIISIAEQFQLPVIEDATEGLGAQYRGRRIGGIAQIGCFSFNGNKIVTTGGGGALVTNNLKWAERAKYLTTQAKDDPLEYVHGEVGFNYRLTNMQAAMGCAQLEQLDSYIEKKRQIARTYQEALRTIPGVTSMNEAAWASGIHWMFTALFDPSQTGITARELMTLLAKRKIQTRPLWQPIHLSPAHKSEGIWDCPIAEALSETALSLPCSVGLTPAEQARVIAEIREILNCSAPTVHPLMPAPAGE